MNQASKLALDLEESIPQAHRSLSVGGVIADVLAVVAAVKGQDWKAAALAVAKLIQDIVGEQPANLNQLGGGKINWQNILAILGKLLPIILGGLVP